jgi:glycosyltransferase involved in cell wall biosynthesis
VSGEGEAPSGRRILVLTSLYPPIARGGYEVECQGVVEHLRERNEVLVLTSSQGQEEASLSPRKILLRRSFRGLATRRAESGEPGVRRELPFLPRRRLTDALSPLYAIRGAKVARRALRDFDPDLVYVWNGAQLPQAAIRVLETAGAPVAYRVCEHWFGNLYRSRYDPFMRGLAGGRWRRSARALNRLPALRIDYQRRVEAAVSWNSEALRRQVEVPLLTEPTAEHVRLPATWQSEELVGLERRPTAEPTIGFVGRVSPEKGVEVAVRALAELQGKSGLKARLEIAGGGPAEHRRELESLTTELGVTDDVAFLGPQDVEGLKRLFAGLHALVVPSVWEEPAGLVLVEGALAGVPLVASRVGGIPEIVSDPETALLCPPGDASALAAALRQTLTEPDATAARAERAREHAQAFRIRPYLAAMDEFLASASPRP